MTSDLDRIAAFVRAFEDRRAREAVPFRYGTALFNRSLPRLWDWNTLRLESADGASAIDLAREADAVQGGAGLLHRKITVDDAAVAERLAPGFTSLGWQTQPLIVMAHRREPDRAPDLSTVAEVSEQALRSARTAAARGDSWSRDPETVRQLLIGKQLRAEATSIRWFAAHVGGEPASYCELYEDGRTAQIEDVTTLPRHRGKGLAGAVVLRALAEARAGGHDLVFLVAAANDWPQQLYGKLGFDPVGRFYSFLRAP
ncbi:MAG: GNAT family N-acetyltransferase [Actinomycetota bacterium]|nr:GNAT family N-acetyltransferase [Actinomycetota bacterium]